MAMVAVKKPPASTPYLAQRRDGALSLTIGCSTRHWRNLLVRVKSSLWLKVHGSADKELANETAKLTRYAYGHHSGGGGTLRQPPSTQR